ncbi:MAG: hypothetical protein K2X35_05695 [Bryobacteraceae bacterium]|nr:hypothetical protein [Bryobacteraceae bacterium]
MAFTLAAALAAASEPEIYRAQTGNNQIEFTATAVTDKLEVAKMLGGFPVDIIIVEIKVTPRTDEPIAISPDDFTLLSHRDGQRSAAFSAAQLAGKNMMVIRRQQRGGGIGAQSPGGWGGVFGGGSAGSGTTSTTEVKATMEQGTTEEKLLKALQEKILPEKTTLDPVSGLLYFPIDDAKVKPKDLTLIYKGPAGRVVAPFEKLRDKR